MAARTPKRRFLMLDELSPVVDSASCYKHDRDYWFRYRVPSHDLLLIESGHVEAKTPDGAFEGKAGDLFCFRPTDWNEYGVTRGTLIYEAHLHFAPLPRHLFTPILGEFGPLPVKVSLGDAFAEMRRVFETICIELPQDGAMHQFRLRAAVHEMLALVSSVLTHKRRDIQHHDKWQRLRLRLDVDLNADISIEDMAHQMNLSRYYFNRAFKQRFGVAPKTYHIHARLREAARLLRGTDKSIKEIAYELGFADANGFTRLFKNHLGVLPSDIRTGTVAIPQEAAIASGHLFPMNTHLVPSQTPSNWLNRHFARRRGRVYAMKVDWKPKSRP